MAAAEKDKVVFVDKEEEESNTAGYASDDSAGTPSTMTSAQRIALPATHLTIASRCESRVMADSILTAMDCGWCGLQRKEMNVWVLLALMER